LGIEDPLLDMSIGLAYIHRAMQRQADNRHLMILQGMTLLFQYYRGMYAKSERYDNFSAALLKQQAEYNIARTMHQLELLTFATKYYEAAITLSEEVGGLGKRDLVMEAAHNLSLIFALTGNLEASRAITEKHMVL
jgi:general transcription factor 3C polypeptide 3 (transcription factor C subunit 4)